MAKRSSALAVRTVRAPAPVIRIAAPRAANVVKAARRTGRMSRRAAVGSHGLTPIAAATTAAVVGYAESSGLLDRLPEIPVIGRKGTLAIAAWYFSKHGGGKIARDVALIAAVLAGHELGAKGSISGDYEG